MKQIHPAKEAREGSQNTLTEQAPALLSRRGFLKYAAAGTLAASAVPVFSPFSSAFAAESEGNHMLILYFSRSGNTRTVAEQIHKRVGGDIIELKTVKPYPKDYDSLTAQAQREQKNKARPEIATEMPHLESYRTVFIGFPNWWSGMPMPFFTLLEKYDLGDKTIVPFCTHGGGRFGHSLRDLKSLCPHARILEAFEVSGSRASGAQNEVDTWLKKLGLLAG